MVWEGNERVRRRLIRCKSNLETERVKKFEQRQEQSLSCDTGWPDDWKKIRPIFQ